MNLARSRAVAMADHFVTASYGPFLTVPCGILAPLMSALQETPPGIIAVPREDNALAIAPTEPPRR